MSIIGTRPEIIRLSRVMAALDRSTEHIVVHTGQNYAVIFLCGTAALVAALLADALSGLKKRRA